MLWKKVIKMTSSTDVTQALKMINNAYANVSPLVLGWIDNDIVKKKLAQSYDAWMHDIYDHGLSLSLADHIINYINNFYALGEVIFQGYK